MNIYAHQPSFVNGTGNFEQPDVLKNAIAQYNGQVISGNSQNIYTFGSIGVNSTNVNPNLIYFYSIWVPLNGVGGSITDMTIDVGTTNGGSQIYNDIPTVTSLTAIDVVVTAGAAIPADTYRVLWVPPNFQLPALLPLVGSLFFRGETKT